MRLLTVIFAGLLFIGAGSINDSSGWESEIHHYYILHYTPSDKGSLKEYSVLIDSGINSVRNFFGYPFNEKFDIFIFPDRQSIDNQWASDWKIPGFKSECWMVASGVSNRLDMISPKKWEEESCEHSYKNRIETQQLITHELVHVLHGQLSNSHDFGDFYGLDWFVEGLATYASGQCNESRISDVKKAIGLKKIPSSLDEFWTGNLKYGLSGSMAMYVDSKYGRSKLKELIKLKTKAELLQKLNVTENDLLEGWKAYMEDPEIKKLKN
jgi:hypothetical protein